MDEAAANTANRMHPNDLRRIVGLAGAATAATACSVAVLGFILLEASFRTWTVGRFFQNRAQVFADLFLVLAGCSALTLILSLLGKDNGRRVGAAFSIATFALIIFIFWLET
jgi:hypothetical protein